MHSLVWWDDPIFLPIAAEAVVPAWKNPVLVVNQMVEKDILQSGITAFQPAQWDKEVSGEAFLQR